MQQARNKSTNKYVQKSASCTHGPLKYSRHQQTRSNFCKINKSTSLKTPQETPIGTVLICYGDRGAEFTAVSPEVFRLWSPSSLTSTRSSHNIRLYHKTYATDAKRTRCWRLTWTTEWSGNYHRACFRVSSCRSR